MVLTAVDFFEIFLSTSSIKSWRDEWTRVIIIQDTASNFPERLITLSTYASSMCVLQCFTPFLKFFVIGSHGLVTLEA